MRKKSIPIIIQTLLTKLICIQMYSHFLSPLYKRNHFNLIKNTWNNSLTWEFTIDKLAILTKPPNQCGKIYTCQNRLFFPLVCHFWRIVRKNMQRRLLAACSKSCKVRSYTMIKCILLYDWSFSTDLTVIAIRN